MVEITNASTLMPTSITVVEDGSTITITTTPLDVSVNTGTLTIQTGGITSVNGDAGPVVVLDTDDISEGAINQYYTNARADARVDLQTGANLDLSQKTTTDLTEGTNQYFTVPRARASISATGDINYDSNTGVISYTAPAAPVTSVNTQTGDVVLTTSDIAEGTNLYYTDAKVQTVIDTNTAGFITASSTDTLTNKSGNISQWTNDAGYITTETDSQTLSFSNPDLTISNGNTVDLSALTPTSLAWSAITGTPTTIAGYGITDGYTDADTQVVINLNTAGFITSTALTPYYTSAQVDALPVSTFTNDAGYLTSETDSQTLSFVSPNLTISNGNTVDLSALTPTSVDWTTVTNTPTTLAGYGITDGYTDADVDTHLNTSTATTGEVLSWTGTDYDWITSPSSNPFDQDLNTTDDVIFNTVTATNEFVGHLDGSIRFSGKNVSGSTILPGQVIYISGLSGNTPEVDLAKADAAGTMPAFGIAIESIIDNDTGQFATFGSQRNLNIANWGETGITFAEGDVLYVSATQAGRMTNVAPTGESNLIQNIGKVERAAPTTNTTIKVGGAGRTNATPNLDQGNIFIGNVNNQSVSASLDTSVGAAGYIKTFNVVDDTTPQLGGTLDVNNKNIENLGSNPYMTLGNNPNLLPATHAIGAWRSASLAGYTGATRPYFNGDVSSIGLGAPVTGSNGRIVNNFAATTLDLQSNDFTSSGITRGLHTWLAQSPTIQNTGGAASTLAQNRNVMVQGMFLEGSNVTVNESSSVYINQFYEGDDGTGTITNAYGLYIRDGGASGATVTNKHSIYSDGATNPMYHAGTITIGAITLPNTDGTTGQVLTTDGAGNLSFATPGPGYSDADVDTHLNTSTATAGEVLSWTGTDYDWITSGGGSSFTGDLAGNTLEDTTNNTISMADPIHITTDAAHTTKPASIRINENDYVDGPSILIQKANGFDIDGGYLQIQKRTNAVTGAYPRLVHVLDAVDVPVGSTTTPTQSMNQQFRRVYYNTFHNAWENYTQTIYEFGLNGNFNINGSNGYVGLNNQRMNWGVPVDMQQSGTSGFAFNTGDTAVYSILTGASQITRNVAIQANTGGGQPTQMQAIDDNAWLNTGVGIYDSRIDPFWAFGTNWKMTMQFSLPSYAAQSSITVDKAFPPVGQIATQFGFVYPSYANAPASWTNTGARQITLTRPASGTNFYEYTFECVNGSLFVRDWRLDNVV